MAFLFSDHFDHKIVSLLYFLFSKRFDTLEYPYYSHSVEQDFSHFLGVHRWASKKCAIWLYGSHIAQRIFKYIVFSWERHVWDLSVWFNFTIICFEIIHFPVCGYCDLLNTPKCAMSCVYPGCCFCCESVWNPAYTFMHCQQVECWVDADAVGAQRCLQQQVKGGWVGVGGEGM